MIIKNITSLTGLQILRSVWTSVNGQESIGVGEIVRVKNQKVQGNALCPLHFAIASLAADNHWDQKNLRIIGYDCFGEIRLGNILLVDPNHRIGMRIVERVQEI